MKRKAVLLIALLSILSFRANAQENDKKYFDINKYIEIFNSTLRDLDIYYVDSIDVEKNVKTAITGMLSNLDPYTNFIMEEEMDDFKFMTTGEYAGIGSYILAREHNGKVAVMITEPYENMPAAKSGLKAGDIILSIDGEDMVKDGSVDKIGRELSNKVSTSLKGQAGTEVVVKIERVGKKKPMEFKVKRELIHVGAVPYYGVLSDNVGYISFSGFTDKSASEVKNAFLDLKSQGITSLIIDIRGNSGGLLDDAIQIVNFFVPKGEVVLTTKGKMKQAERTYRTTLAPIDTEIPIAILVDRGSASSSEILSGSLQDMDRAVILGQRTFGKGLVQMTRELPYGASLKITSSKYYIPSGRCIQAIDYTHRNEDGSVGRIPDSLTHVFKTASGREVRDGGGISPDFELEPEKYPSMLYYLINQNIVFDFATIWTEKNPKIASANEFSISDKDYEEFKAFVKTKDFKYDQTSEKTMSTLKEIMEFEGYMKTAEDEFKALEAKLVPDLDRDLETFKNDIVEYLNMEIAKRYYYNRGETIVQLRNDNVVKKAIEVLNDKDLYAKTLQPKASEEAQANIMK
ncbi:S41 family peptidase [Dysgonomonas sp. 520]|uniref:S41 family peptidase n=1 Tax=Dysgonomonas sp. 520 TaxID=2302931 RepID=UPI0013D5C236|nr:S41 family peptidase [Dysgonomonas sp. 520]NDW08843.1 S41 family peptidase [Dysgonomonas sp. 520]